MRLAVLLTIVAQISVCGLSQGGAADEKLLRIGEPPLPAGGPLNECAGGRILFSDDGRLLLTEHVTCARIWDVAALKPVGNPLPGGSLIDEIAFVAHGSLIFIASTPAGKSAGLVAQYFDAPAGRPASPEFDLGRDCRSSVSSGDGKYIAELLWRTGAAVNTIKVIDRSNGRVVFTKTLANTADEIRLNADGGFIAYREEVAPRALAMRLIRLRDGKLLFEDALQRANRDFMPENVAFSPNGERVAIGDEKGFKVIDLPTVAVAYDSPALCPPAAAGESPYISPVWFSPDGAFVLASLRNGLRRWNCVTGEMSAPILTPWWLSNSSMSRDGKRRSGSYSRHGERGFAVIDLDTGRPVWHWPRPSSPSGTALAADGRHVALSDIATHAVYIVDLGGLQTPPGADKALKR